MNHKNRRTLQKNLRDENVSSRIANVINNTTIHDGDLVVLNVPQITGHKDYPHMREEYRQFVESNRNKIFVAHPYYARSGRFSAIIELEGTNWMFWCGDLIRAENIQPDEDE